MDYLQFQYYNQSSRDKTSDLIMMSNVQLCMCKKGYDINDTICFGKSVTKPGYKLQKINSIIKGDLHTV